MTSRDVTDEQLGQLARRQYDLFRRVREGSIPVEEALKGLQTLIEAKPLIKNESPVKGKPIVAEESFVGMNSRLHVDYGPESLKKLNAKYTRYDAIFDGRPWERHSSCEKIDETSGEREFCILEVPKNFCDGEIGSAWNGLAEHFGKLGYRFAIQLEAEVFGMSRDWPVNKGGVLALGSYVWANRERHVLTVSSRYDDRIKLYSCWIKCDLTAGTCLLLVRKSP